MSNRKAKWNGFDFARNRSVNLDGYKSSWSSANHEVGVCPYCDGSRELPELDHYYPKSVFPQLAVSPWNLVPVCQHCNHQHHGKGSHPMLSEGESNPSKDWLHPYFRPAPSGRVLELTGPPKNVEIKLKSPTGATQAALDNHVSTIKKLGHRWKKEVGRYHDTLVNRARARKIKSATQVDSWIAEYHRDAVDGRGRDAFTLVHIAVCEAIINRRPGYLDEIFDSNPLGLS
ncbi:MAG: HNH endonuclease [Bdellovibrionaceae bacterium]|nr:HNH endonuclease [Pseudobdellovibrionaceae bacterium]